MIFAPARLGSVTLDNETLAADKKGCRRFGPCGVGEKALYLNSFFIDRHYYVALSSVRRVFKRVAMSKGGFTGKGAFGSIPYLVVEYDGGEKQCNFKHEEDVDNLLAYLYKLCPQGGAAHGPAAGRERPPLSQGADAPGPGRKGAPGAGPHLLRGPHQPDPPPVPGGQGQAGQRPLQPPL